DMQQEPMVVKKIGIRQLNIQQKALIKEILLLCPILQPGIQLEKKGVQEFKLKMHPAPSVKLNLTGEALKGKWRTRQGFVYDRYPFIRVKIPKMAYEDSAGGGSILVDTEEPFTLLAYDDLDTRHTEMQGPGVVFRHLGGKDIDEIQLDMPSGIEYIGDVGNALADKKQAMMIFAMKAEGSALMLPGYISVFKDGKFRARLARGTTYYRYLRVVEASSKNVYHKLKPYTVPSSQVKVLKEDIHLGSPGKREEVILPLLR
ncbi:hypothetical protein BVX99_00665, partial [bacterium F16]